MLKNLNQGVFTLVSKYTHNSSCAWDTWAFFNLSHKNYKLKFKLTFKLIYKLFCNFKVLKGNISEIELK